MKKKILYLRTDLCKDTLVAGGSVSHTLGVIEGLLHHDYEVIVASSVMIEQFEGLALKELKHLTLPLFFQKLKWRIQCLAGNLFFTFQSYRLIKKYALETIYQRYGILNCSGVILSFITKKPLLLEYNGSEAWIDQEWSPKKFFKLSWLVRAIEWINIHYAHCLVVVSEPLKDELLKRGVKPQKILVNPNGVNTQKLDPDRFESTRTLLRKQLNLEQCFVFGFVGTFSVWHGIDMLVAMIPAIVSSKPQARFLLIGDGDLFADCKQKLELYITSGHVLCTGLLPSVVAQEYLSVCDAFLCPTQPNKDGTPFFGSPTKLFEYLSMAKPLIASKLDQVKEVVSPALCLEDLQKKENLIDQQVGITLDPKNEQAFIKAACSLMDFSTNDLQKMGNNARLKACQEYDWNIHVAKIMYYNEHSSSSQSSSSS